MAAKTTLLVPIRIDGLYADSAGLQFGPTMADFSTLPYYSSNGSPQNAKTPNLAESTVGQTNSLAFPKGLHLHWALPDALTTGYHRGDDTAFPPVPNRWLVRRLDHTGKLQRSTIVESDFLHPLDGEGKPTFQQPEGSAAWAPITFPVKRKQVSDNKPGAAFRYMGRSQSLENWLKPSPGSEYLNQRDSNSKYIHSDFPLTAVGYGEPSFAAYYPNSYSVFGFCDADADLQPGNSYEYQVIGWLNEADLDPLQSPDFTKLDKNVDPYNALATEYKWFVDKAQRSNPFPSRTLFYGSLTLTPNQVKRWEPDNNDLRIAVGNTGGEALAALLADGLDAADKVIIEDQLEAINVASSLQGVEVDYLAHFAQTRHQRGFRGVGAGSRWDVLPKKSLLQPLIPAGENKEAVTQPTLPDAVAHALDALNTAQEDYDKAQQEIVELRYQTFCDWHKFLVAAYSDSVDIDFFTAQITNLAQFVSDQTLKLLNEKIDAAGKLTLGKDVVKAQAATPVTLTLATNTTTPAQVTNENLAVQVILRLQTLIESLKAAKITDKYEIRNRPAEHFWRPREPVVLLSGPVAVSTQRHGEDGDLPCNVIDLPEAPGTKAFFDTVDKLKPNTPNNPFVQTQSSSPWHPIILDWSVAVAGVATGRPANSATNGALDYAPTFLSSTFQLQQNDPDFLPPQGLSLLTADQYDGRCLMTPTASTQIDTNLRTFLIRSTLDDCRDRAAGADPNYIDRLIAWYQVKHNAKPPDKNPEKIVWLKQQRPFVVDGKKDENGNPILLPAKDLSTWYGDKPINGPNNTVKSLDAARKAQDPIYSAIRALDQLEGMPVLSQALGGFNAALMTRRQVLQIPIENPVERELLPRAFFGNLDLTNRVAQAVGRHHPMAPVASRVFSPIRSGTLALQSLGLNDTFGQRWTRKLDEVKVVTSNSLFAPNLGAKTIYLPPRLSSAARLNFRWLAAMPGRYGVDEVEMNSAPVTTPICGWLIPNNFDNSLMVYDNTGKSLGSVNLLAQWSPAPGDIDRLTVDKIENPHLRRVVQRLVVDVGMEAKETTLRQNFLAGFLSTLDSAIEAIEPANFAQHEALALLMGRPIAVVRARVELQLMGQPTHSQTVDDPSITGSKTIRLQQSQHWKSFVNQDWNVFAYDWGQFYGCDYDAIKNQSCLFFSQNNDNYARTTHGFEKVSIPMRLGEHQLLNDGLVGFWKETADGELNNVFHAPQTLEDLKLSADVTYKEGLTTPCIRAYVKGVTDNLSLTINDDPLGLTILMDPRGVVHATCGILPVYKLEIPPAYYAGVLKRMGVTFRVSPILTDAEELHAALPKEAGYVWSWITQPQVSKWEETSVIADATEHAHFFKPPKIVEGWLKLTPREGGKEN